MSSSPPLRRPVDATVPAAPLSMSWAIRIDTRLGFPVIRPSWRREPEARTG